MHGVNMRSSPLFSARAIQLSVLYVQGCVGPATPPGAEEWAAMSPLEMDQDSGVGSQLQASVDSLIHSVVTATLFG